MLGREYTIHCAFQFAGGLLVRQPCHEFTTSNVSFVAQRSDRKLRSNYAMRSSGIEGRKVSTRGLPWEGAGWHLLSLPEYSNWAATKYGGGSVTIQMVYCSAFSETKSRTVYSMWS